MARHGYVFFKDTPQNLSKPNWRQRLRGWLFGGWYAAVPMCMGQWLYNFVDGKPVHYGTKRNYFVKSGNDGYMGSRGLPLYAVWKWNAKAKQWVWWSGYRSVDDSMSGDHWVYDGYIDAKEEEAPW